MSGKTSDGSNILQRHRADRKKQESQALPRGPQVPVMKRPGIVAKIRVGFAIKNIITDPHMLDKLKSRKLWVTVAAGAAATILNQLGVDQTIINNILLLAGAYVGVEGVVDVARSKQAKP